MKCMIVLSALVALAAAKPSLFPALPYSLGYNAITPYAHPYLATSYAAPVVATSYASPVVSAPVVSAPAVVAAPALAGVKTQYHAQDELGQASYGHSEPLQAHSAVQDASGNKVGSFSYVAPTGQVFRTDYVADALGYRVNSNALPVGPGPVADTPEVVAARAAHLAAHSRVRRGVFALGHTPAATAPLTYAAPVAYTAPVAYSSPIAYSAPVAYHSPIAYSAPVAAAPLVRPAIQTTIVNNPGHAVSYRVD